MTIKEAIETLNFHRGRGLAKDAVAHPDVSQSAVNEAIDLLILEVAGELARKKLEFVVDKSSLPDSVPPPPPVPVKDRLLPVSVVAPVVIK